MERKNVKNLNIFIVIICWNINQSTLLELIHLIFKNYFNVAPSKCKITYVILFPLDSAEDENVHRREF